MKKLNRSKLLSIVTVGAIVVTTAFSFAAWGTTEATTGGKDVTIDPKISTTATALTEFTKPADFDPLSGSPKYESDVTFTVTNAPANAKLTLTPTVKRAGVSITDYEVKFYETGTSNEVTTPGVKSGANSYDIVLTPTTNAPGGETVSVEVMGVLTK